MTLVFNRRRKAPQTHVLIIGVGGYRHLMGHPVGPQMKDPYLFGGLGQLTSPPLSAIEMIDVFTEAPDAWRPPLGSVDVLISPHPSNPEPAGAGVKFTNPTGANIKRAFRAWWARCNSETENAAVLYLCGHGIQYDEQYFLASDFGANPLDPWENAIAVDSTIKGLWHNKAQTQCVYVDACREIVPATSEISKVNARPLAPYYPGNQTYNVYDIDIRAVAPSEQAFASPNSTAYFTQALSRALRGGAATEDDTTGDWLVTIEGVAAKFHDIVSELAPHRGETPRPHPGRSTVLYQPPATPMVNLTIGCRPDVANEIADLSYKPNSGKPDNDELVARGERQLAPWTIPVAAGYYTLYAAFDPDCEFNAASRQLLVTPPARRPELQVK